MNFFGCLWQSTVLGCTALLVGCTPSVANMAPTPPTGEKLSLVLDAMAEAAKKPVAESDSQPADRAIRAVEAWRGGGESD